MLHVIPVTVFMVDDVPGAPFPRAQVYAVAIRVRALVVAGGVFDVDAVFGAIPRGGGEEMCRPDGVENGKGIADGVAGLEVVAQGQVISRVDRVR